MSGRISSRSAAKRDQPSSPPKQTSNRGSESPTRRRTRSQSVELGTKDTSNSNRRIGKRSARQGSVESDASTASSGSGVKGRRKRGTRAAALANNLSIVAEDEEAEESEEGDALYNNHGSEQRSQSPDAMSQMSGTTAITSHSEAEMQDLDPNSIVEILPDLFTSSRRILKQLAPSGSSLESVEATIKELRILGSGSAVHLKRAEDKFKPDRSAYGNDTYIKASIIMRKLFDSPDPPIGSFRPDAILQAANLATLVRDLLVAQKEGRTTYEDIGEIDQNFPNAFLSKFGGDIDRGESDLKDESFSIGLELRTQHTILALVHFKENLIGSSQIFDPDRILGGGFIDPPVDLDPELGYLEDCLQNGQVKDIMRMAPNSKEQVEQIKNRIVRMSESFRDGPDAGDDLVDFDFLEEQFPWIIFITQFVLWIRSRLDEINESVIQRGGTRTILKGLMGILGISESQVELESSPPSTSIMPRGSMPPSNIQTAVSATNLYNNNKQNILLLEKIRRGITSHAPRLNQDRGKAGKAAPPDILRTAPQAQVEDMTSPADDEVELGANEPQSTSEALVAWNRHENDKNKENRPLPSGDGAQTIKKRYIDRQPDARQLTWEDYDLQAGSASSSKRKRPQESEEEESQDEGFEEDKRYPNSARKINNSAVRQRAPIRKASPKRSRASLEEDAPEAERRNRERAESILQRSARGASEEDQDNGNNDDGDDDEGDEGDDTDRPILTHIRIAAATASQRARQGRAQQPQTRLPWSERDNQHMIDLIEEHGCGWSNLSKIAEFERGEVGQVALKDKARNLKVMLLKAGMELPVNFEKVALGKKEIESVRAVFPDYS